MSQQFTIGVYKGSRIKLLQKAPIGWNKIREFTAHNDRITLDLEPGKYKVVTTRQDYEGDITDVDVIDITVPN